MDLFALRIIHLMKGWHLRIQHIDYLVRTPVRGIEPMIGPRKIFLFIFLDSNFANAPVKPEDGHVIPYNRRKLFWIGSLSLTELSKFPLVHFLPLVVLTLWDPARYHKLSMMIKNWLLVAAALSFVLWRRFTRKKHCLNNIPGLVSASWLAGEANYAH